MHERDGGGILRAAEEYPALFSLPKMQTRIALRATPTIDTALGPIRYPQPITIVSRQVGGN